jgi:hypothetical protein
MSRAARRCLKSVEDRPPASAEARGECRHSATAHAEKTSARLASTPRATATVETMPVTASSPATPRAKNASPIADVRATSPVERGGATRRRP